MQRLPMRKIRDVLRLKFENNLSNRRIAQSNAMSRATVTDYLSRFYSSGLPWPLPDDLDDEALEQHLFAPPDKARKKKDILPDWHHIHKNLRRSGVTLNLLWQEYKAGCPEGYQYSHFCDKYREWRSHLDVVMRQNHLAGDKLFLDYAGQTMPITNPSTGEIRQAQIFVATLGASSYTYCEATLSQSLPDWIGSHVRTFEHLGGVPNVLVPDNLKSAVTNPHRYEPDKNPTYQDLAEHYHVAVVPARVRKPQDKGKVESAVQIVERWILARLRDCTFFSLQALNEAIKPLLEELNNKPFQNMPDESRRTLFETLDKPALKPLPAERYQFAQWKEARVHMDYHIEVDKHFYSVPYNLVKKQLSVRITGQTIECFHKRKRVASHVRSYLKGRHTTQPEHMPEKHRCYAEWTPERLQNWAAKTGGHTEAVITHILESRKYPEQAFRSCLGIIHLGKRYTPERLERACQRALHLGSCSYKTLEAILRHGQDNLPLPEEQPLTELPDRHENVRGSVYYN
ncbi:IS21 family transposase [Sansalvadorimonas verongulae]|uniref:IS21 family transposase n=1 Tax=Sansalvadorimonas verongulae TaxID=2172824 RepID=UPI0012BCD67E|nr:IS21 family transposase [Sansalvadorimonas verongulae]MTI11867.1 IS21 family transposase [Sansalvadorimonas verongulae]